MTLLKIRAGMITTEQVINAVEIRIKELRSAQPPPWAHLSEATDESLLNKWLVRSRMSNFLGASLMMD